MQDKVRSTRLHKSVSKAVWRYDVESSATKSCEGPEMDRAMFSEGGSVSRSLAEEVQSKKTRLC